MTEGTITTPIQRAQAPREEVDLRLIELLAEQNRRVPLPVALLMVLVAGLGLRVLPDWIPAAWLALALGMLLVRWRLLAALPLQVDRSAADRVRTAGFMSLASGCTLGLTLFAFPMLDETERSFITLLTLGLATGAVGTTAGRSSLFLPYVVPMAAPLPLLWAIHPGPAQSGWIDLSIGLLLLLYLWVLAGLANNAWRNFTESVQIRYHERALNEQLTEALEQANQANLAKTRFLAAASHDLRQPLHTIGLLVAALSLRQTEGRDREVVDLLSQVSADLSEQLDQLLDISKLDAGVLKPVYKMVDLGEMLRMHHAEMRAVIEARGLRVVLDAPTGVRCRTDPTLLLRVLRNLTDNAAKFTERGAVTLRLRVEGGTARISVEDTGRGIPAGEQEMVFEEFYQVGNPERDRSKGLGLGLSIVRRLSKLLGIGVDLHSDADRGTTVTLAVPLHGQADALPQAREPARVHSFAGRTVLVVDDERSVRIGMRVLLEELGCSCLEASCGEEALRHARGRKPDVILADLRLRNGETGIDVISQVVAAVGATPSLLISGDTAPDRLQEAQRAGIKLLHKPVGLPALQGELARMLGAPARRLG
ncbi:hybrid sensor histidine kinase/response regulator [Ramlibacter sp. PS3R-8]|uniref:hybrid sensor histidine kinase/response regulator n=1 Tax=Ramlibacter sp. PS3R-8 TaxID=3133437 RepID=UPI0030B76919